MTKNKIQSLIVEHLLKYGQLEVTLPDGVKVAIGLTQEDKNGEQRIQDDYCWVIASQGNRSTSIDSYNMGLKFNDDSKTIVVEDSFVEDGKQIRRLDVV